MNADFDNDAEYDRDYDDETARMDEFFDAVEAARPYERPRDLDHAETYYPDDEPEPVPARFCDNYTPHEPHLYRALNTETYRCGGLTRETYAGWVETTSTTCEHGLSAWLCSGPNHY